MSLDSNISSDRAKDFKSDEALDIGAVVDVLLAQAPHMGRDAAYALAESLGPVGAAEVNEIALSFALAIQDMEHAAENGARFGSALLPSSVKTATIGAIDPVKVLAETAADEEEKQEAQKEEEKEKKKEAAQPKPETNWEANATYIYTGELADRIVASEEAALLDMHELNANAASVPFAEAHALAARGATVA